MIRWYDWIIAIISASALYAVTNMIFVSNSSLIVLLSILLDYMLWDIWGAYCIFRLVLERSYK